MITSNVKVKSTDPTLYDSLITAFKSFARLLKSIPEMATEKNSLIVCEYTFAISHLATDLLHGSS